MLLGEGDVESVVGCSSLQFEIEAAAETLAQRQTPGFVDARAKRRMNDQLHAAAFIEEALGNDCALRGNGPENSPAFENVLNGLRRAGFIEATFVQFEPGDRSRRPAADLRETARPERTPGRRSLISRRSSATCSDSSCVRAGASPSQKGTRRWRAMRIFDQHPTRLAFNAANAPGSVAQQHDVAGVAFDREIFVEGSDDAAFGLGDHCEQSSLRNGAAAGDRSQPGSTAGAQFAIHTIVMKICAVSSTARGNAFRKHFNDRIEKFARKIAIRIGALDQSEQFVLIPAGSSEDAGALARRSVGSIVEPSLDWAGRGRHVRHVVRWSRRSPQSAAPSHPAANRE